MKSLIAAAILLATSAAHAVNADLNCVSYSKEYVIQVSISGTGAVALFKKSTARGDFAIAEGRVELPRQTNHSLGWIGFEGYSAAGNHILMSAKIADLQNRGTKMIAIMAVSSTYGENVEHSHQLNCIPQ
jgi:hypothetical protein